MPDIPWKTSQVSVKRDPDLVIDAKMMRMIHEKMQRDVTNLSRAVLGLSPLSEQEFAKTYSWSDWQVKKTLRRLKRRPNHKRNRNAGYD